jgi:aromatic ring-opening dioxygenase LigB subunit
MTREDIEKLFMQYEKAVQNEMHDNDFETLLNIREEIVDKIYKEIRQ